MTPTATPNPLGQAAASPADQILNKLNALAERQEKLEKNLQELTSPDPNVRKNGPFARTGEDIMSSRGFMLSRLAGVAVRKLDPAHAKIEIDLCNRLQADYVSRGLYHKHDNASVVVPLSSDLMAQAGPENEKLAEEIGQVMKAGVAGANPDEMRRIASKHYGSSQVQKTLSWLDASAMGTLVPPPVFGEPIELLRNEEVFMRAGARVTPFPPSGRAVWPRFTGATSANWLGTGANDRTIPPSEPTTGDVVLTVKKLGVFVEIPNELFRFPTVSVEQVVRADMMKSAALKMDRAFLDGTGSAYEPKGLINYDGINVYTAGTVTVDGNYLEPEDILKLVATVEEQNLDFGCWVGRAQLYAQLGNRRADAVTAGDKKGMFLFNTLREGNSRSALGDVTQPGVGTLEGYPFLKSNQVSKLRTKGASTNLTYLLGGQFNQYMIALSGVMEFMITNVGDSNFSQDRSTLRLITWCDGAPRHEEAFVFVDSLFQTA